MRMRSASWLLGAQVLNLLVSLPMSVLLARSLGASGKGTLTVVQLIATMGAAILNFGLSASFTYLAARSEATARDVIRLSLAMSGAIATVAVALAAFVGQWAAHSLLHVDSVVMVFIGCAAIGPALFAQFMSAFLIGGNRVRSASLVNIYALGFQLGVDLVLFLSGHLVPITAVLVWAVAVTGSAIAFGILANSVVTGGRNIGAVRLMRLGYRFGLATWASSVLATLSLRQDMFFVAYYLGVRAVGIYSIAVTLAELSWYIPSALNGVLMPKVAAEGDTALELTQRLTRVAWPVTLVAASLVALFAIPIVPIVFGAAFSASLVPLVALIPGIAATAMASMPSAYVVGIGQPMDWTKASLANLFSNFLANVVLIPIVGVVGAAIASSISYGVSTAIIIWFFLRRTDTKLADLLVPRVSDFAELYAAIRTAIVSRRAVAASGG